MITRVCVVLLAASSLLSGALVTFDELVTQSADGLSLKGVTLSFTEGGSASTNAIFNQNLPVSSTYLDSQVLQGPITGVLGFVFTASTPTLQFALLLNTLDLERPGASVELFDDGAQSLGVFALDTDPLMQFSEGLFSYSGTAVKSAVVTFSGTTAADIFAVDNLSFSTSRETQAPEPGTVFLMAAGVACVLVRSRLRQERS